MESLDSGLVLLADVVLESKGRNPSLTSCWSTMVPLVAALFSLEVLSICYAICRSVDVG